MSNLATTKMRTIGTKELLQNFDFVTEKVQRHISRRITTVSGNGLAKEIRRNLKTMLSANSRSRLLSAGEAALSGDSSLGLAREIINRFWSVPRKGIVGAAVGGSWPGGAHAHLVEFGHEIVTPKTKRRTGKRTRPIPFQRKAEESFARVAIGIQQRTFTKELAKVRIKRLKQVV